MDFSTASRTPTSTPSSSPGLFSPTTNPLRIPLPPLSDGTPQASPYLHPLQMHKVRETHKAQVEQDYITGRKLINQYEVIEEIGRGVHGKVKLARSLETGENVAIKIIQRFSKKRRLGRVTVSPEDKTKREIAILKKVRHPNVVGLLEVIDDPELKKIYMVLEHVELGEITWRKKGAPQICLYERRRVEMEQRGLAEDITGNDEKYFKMMERRRRLKERKRAGLSLQQVHDPADYWSLEHGDDHDEYGDMVSLSQQKTHGSTHALSARQSTSVSDRGGGSFPPSRTPSRAPSRASSRAHTPLPEYDIPPLDSDNEDETPGPHRPNRSSLAALEGTYYGSYPDEPPNRVRSPSINDSIISRMSSLDDIPHDAFEEDYSYVPWFSLDQARSAFRDTVLGLEYLHYEGIVHRDIKPANLLWTKDHRVKISDFGVSYFGRPIREGETEENISEADAKDFDDDLELAKTVGTPAFFAPELCYTDLDMEQPKITEQIDVWSLGVTLYCLIFARIPFLADDEYQLFRCIAKEDVYIPKRRLKAVDPLSSTSTSQTSLNKRSGPVPAPYREDGELAYEDVDDELYDLLRRMLVKDPAERMKLREVKRHPWVIRGIDNVIGWLDDTDPSRRTAGRRIQVDARELEVAVVPITFLERARSAVKKTINKVIGVTRSETRGESSRKRAISSATSSGADVLHTPLTPGIRETRRSSLRGDESFFATIRDHQHEHREPYEHPLSQSLTASPDLSTSPGDPFERIAAQYPAKAGATPKGSFASTPAAAETRPGPPDRSISAAASIETVIRRSHSHSKSATNVPLSNTGYDEGPSSLPFTDHSGGMFEAYMWQYGRGREALAEIEEGTTSRARSVDRSLFESENKHSDPSVAVSATIAPGHVEHTTVLNYRPSRSANASPTNDVHDKPLPSPLFFQPAMVHAHQSISTPNFPHSKYAASNLDDRPSTANKTPEEKAPSRAFGATPESFPLVQESLNRRRVEKREEDAERKQQQFDGEAFQEVQTTPDIPSADDRFFTRKEEDTKRAQSYDSVYSTGQASATSPSDVTSPVSSDNLGSQEQIFPSVPSLPALISGASSVSADTEGEFLQQPGVTCHTEPGFTAESTPETLTPPSISKQSTRESEVLPRTMEANGEILLSPDVDEEGYNGDGDTARACLAGEDSDSDSDEEGLTMTRRKKPPVKVASPPSAMPRRGTNASAGSTETAKQVMMDS
ncbi:Protein kinase-like (PK-like) [Venustampulla echinocandica]|uniref:non-specific serine/threonine protein kinase n=1 Tax=Venustampulla echinocandica TaxID=2656787 RepID=A0A370TR41_9HELO|nr:Protein kinase-like (PK-like) [Venustampulla echinocandica]RDL37987.1 Protein kinase-like (PK-like) [Venustampulla echinocandica]